MYFADIEIHPKKTGEGALQPDFTPFLRAFLPDDIENVDENDKNIRRKSVIISPGSGYRKMGKKGPEIMAMKLASEGYNAFVLNYSCFPATFPTAVVELACAVALIRENCELYHADPEKIVVGGFSAGGHLSGCLASLWHTDYLQEQTGMNPELYKPNGFMSGYGTVTSEQFDERNSFIDALLPKNYTQEMLRLTSVHEQVTENMPKTFWYHNFDDPVVPVESCFLIGNALKAHKIPLEMHIFPEGGHGENFFKHTPKGEEVYPEHAPWFSLFVNWLSEL